MATTTSKKKAAAVAAVVTSEEEEEETDTDDTATLIKAMAAQFTQFNKKIDNMEAKLTTSLEENKKLQKELREKTKVIEDLQHSYSSLEIKLNTMEQYNRSWSVRILNIPLTNEEERNPFLVREKVYRLAFHPILVGAMADGVITYMPSAGELIEMAHILPGKAGSHKPIIARFRDRILRTICLRLKKAYAPRSDKPGGPSTGSMERDSAAAGGVGAVGGGGVTDVDSGAGGGGGGSRSGGARGGGGGTRSGGAGWHAFPFHEDLTVLNFKMMKAIGADKRVQSCWSINGQLRYTLVNDSEIRRVVSVFDNLTTILGPA